ncbi:MAG: NAD(+)/NADH kinase [Phycisphaerales bacterium]|nr:NAD(+)/NADH kinase [Phycisphaerales bacterium]
MDRPALDNLLVLADRSRPEVDVTFREIQSDLPTWAHEVTILDADDSELPAGLVADRAIVIGGDGSMIAQARRLVGQDIPLIGVNCGRLGFLAAFDPMSLRQFEAKVFGAAPPMQRHLLLTVEHHTSEGLSGRYLAVNDAVIRSGPPWRMLELAMFIGGVPGPHLRGDGLVIASPTGSTAHNLSAGGPIIGPGVDALVVSPLAPQSLAFRPTVLAAQEGVEVEVIHGNTGTTLILDGQQDVALAPSDRVTVHRADQSIAFVTRPDEPFWQILLDRMRWAAPPVYR